MTFAAAPTVPGYRLLRRIGRGGSGEVYEGRAEATGGRVAVKVLHVGAGGRHAGSELDHEWDAPHLGETRHGALMPTYAVGQTASVRYSVMPLAEGGSLKRLISAGCPLPVEWAAGVIEQIASALEHLHQHRLLHLDVKPSNVLLTGDGRALLGDLGNARAVNGGDQTALRGLIGGTPGYMAPEQRHGGPLDARTDVFGLAVTACELLTGCQPFPKDSPTTAQAIPQATLNPRLNQRVGAVLLRGMAPNPEDRFESAGGFAAALTASLRPFRHHPNFWAPVGRWESPTNGGKGWADGKLQPAELNSAGGRVTRNALPPTLLLLLVGLGGMLLAANSDAGGGMVAVAGWLLAVRWGIASASLRWAPALLGRLLVAAPTLLPPTRTRAWQAGCRATILLVADLALCAFATAALLAGPLPIDNTMEAGRSLTLGWAAVLTCLVAGARLLRSSGLGTLPLALLAASPGLMALPNLLGLGPPTAGWFRAAVALEILIAIALGRSGWAPWTRALVSALRRSRHGPATPAHGRASSPDTPGRQRPVRAAALGLVLLCLAGCAGDQAGPQPVAAPTPSSGAAESVPIDAIELTQPVELVFWHQHSVEFDPLQQRIIDEFTTRHPNITIKTEAFPHYNRIYQRVLGAIQAGGNSTPDLVATFESQAAEYYEAGAVAPFDDYVASPRYGLTAAEQADFVPSYIDATRFPQYGGKRLTYPFTKSALLLYTNLRVLRSLGFQQPAATWGEFLSHCRRAASLNRECYAMEADPSTVDGIIFSYGGEVAAPDGTRSRFDEPATAAALDLYATLGEERLGYLAPGSGLQIADLASGKALYLMRSSSALPRLDARFPNPNDWEVSIIPQGRPDKKVTVLYGANITIMKSTPEKQLAAWLFIKYFTQPDVTARWGLDPSNGYFPLRSSGLNTPESRRILGENPHFAKALEISRFARVEPSALGWQQVRLLLQEAATDVFLGRLSVDEARRVLVERANRVLGQQ
ncbi:MAG: extracellular solute-binding protein [Dehalococcoidia bacterium]|nr:extracellular solute-binding protein [Dehalococcoidia bacterium]